MNEIDIYLHSMQSMCPMIKNEHLVSFKKSLSIKSFRKGEIIFPMHEQHDSIIFVTKGLVRAFYINSKGEEKNAWFVKEYEFVSDYPSFLSNSNKYCFWGSLPPDDRRIASPPAAAKLHISGSCPEFDN